MNKIYWKFAVTYVYSYSHIKYKWHIKINAYINLYKICNENGLQKEAAYYRPQQ